MIAQHPQFIETMQLVLRLKALDLKARTNKQAAFACDWITTELRRRAAAALHGAGLPPLDSTKEDI